MDILSDGVVRGLLRGLGMEAVVDLVADMPLTEVQALLEALPPEPSEEEHLPADPMEQAQKLVEEFVSRPHLAYLSDRITQAVKDVENGQERRLIIEMPPRAGKSLLVTQVTSGWVLSKHPDWDVILASYSYNLVLSWSRQVKRWVEEAKLGKRLRAASDSRSVENWQTTSGGKVTPRSVGADLTGFGGKLIVIDDPHKGFAEAHSKKSRDRVWDWWLTDVQTRRNQPALLIVIMCMTGDTPVLRPDGTETPLRDIRPGDEIATYENGGLTTSRVMNWANQGPDDVFSIRLESGRVVRANARHPFLTVDENGVEAWQRTDQLTPGSSILTATGESGEASSAKSQAALSRSAARESAGRTTTSVARLTVIDLPQLTPTLAELRGSSTATASQRRSTTLWLRDSEDSARSAESLLPTDRRTGAASSASTTIMSPVESGGFSATTATSSSSGTSRLNDSEPPLSTWSVTPDRIVSLEPAGREDVFDLQVERTENFIANGLVSHNTRWHEDDLAGRLLSKEYPGNPDEWEVVSFPAIAEREDVLGRAEGDPLYSPLVEQTREEALAEWERVRENVGSYTWSALYQQRPAPPSGSIFSTDWWHYWTDDPARADADSKVIYLDPQSLSDAVWLDSWDLTFKGSAGGDWVVGQRWARQGADRFLIGQQRGRWGFTDQLAAVERWASPESVGGTGKFVHRRLVEDSANGPALIETLRSKISGIKAIRALGSKENRAHAITPEIESGNVYLPHPSMPGYGWVTELISEFRNFPNDAHDDQVDALSQALLELRESHGTGSISVPRGTIDTNPMRRSGGVYGVQAGSRFRSSR